MVPVLVTRLYDDVVPYACVKQLGLLLQLQVPVPYIVVASITVPVVLAVVEMRRHSDVNT